MGPALAPGLIALAIVASGVLAITLARRMEPLRPVAAALVLIAFTIADLAYSNGPGGATALPPEHYAVLRRRARFLVGTGFLDDDPDALRLSPAAYFVSNSVFVELIRAAEDG